MQPHNHRHVLGTLAEATQQDAKDAIDAAAKAARDWRELAFDDRAAVLLKAADLLSGPWRARLNAATMLGQSKTIQQAEIDAACELADFWRFNVAFARQILQEQPTSGAGVWNRTDYRPLEGFVYAITPFNFTAIAGNLPTAAALMGNTVLWKPSVTQQFSAHLLMRLLEEAGLPAGVINMLTGSGVPVSEVALTHPDLAGIHFTGSTRIFQHLWRTVGTHIDGFRSYPRLVGETGGKDFVLVHASADPAAVKTALTRGAFEYQGQKCSAASRAYLPRGLWNRIKDELIAEADGLSMGDVTDLGNFMGAVIDERAFAKHKAAIDRAHAAADIDVLAGGTYDDAQGYFVRPTLLGSDNPDDEIFSTEYFGPILSVHVYEESDFDAVVERIDHTSPYALTGSILSTDHHGAGLPPGGGHGLRASRPATSTSTTSPPAPSSASSPSAAAAPRAPMTRPARRRTCCAGPAPGRSRRPSSRRPTIGTRTWAEIGRRRISEHAEAPSGSEGGVRDDPRNTLDFRELRGSWISRR